MSRSIALIIAASFVSVSPVEGSTAFLGSTVPHLRMNAAHLLEDLEQALGAELRAKVEARTASMEEAMRPVFQALPKNRDLLQPTAVRYLLHRFFVDRHGWFVNGFDTEGNAWDVSSASDAFAQHSEGTRDLFEKRISRGMPLHEIALLGATLESLVHVETVKRLHKSYSLLGLAQAEEHPTEKEAVEALDLYMVMYLFGSDPDNITVREVSELRKAVGRYYPNWLETRKWLHEVRKEVLAETPEDRNSFEASVRVIEAVADRYGKWQDKECIALKESLLQYERVGTGRVPLTTFYKAALNGHWHFRESKAYLEHMGALDNTDVNRPSVIIPNYVNSPANCVGGSRFYSVCCINECEALLGYFEQEIAAPQASVQAIVNLTQQLPSATEDAPRVLPEQLVKRLQEIADHHGGFVPLHARLFNQWLHHAYPRECPYPHLSGTAKLLTPNDFVAATGFQVIASEDEMRAMTAKAVLAGFEDASDHLLNEELPWASYEELFLGDNMPQPIAQAQPNEAAAGNSVVRFLMVCVAAASLARALSGMFTQAKGALMTYDKSKVEKDCFV